MFAPLHSPWRVASPHLRRHLAWSGSHILRVRAKLPRLSGLRVSYLLEEGVESSVAGQLASAGQTDFAPTQQRGTFEKTKRRVLEVFVGTAGVAEHTDVSTTFPIALPRQAGLGLAPLPMAAPWLVGATVQHRALATRPRSV